MADGDVDISGGSPDGEVEGEGSGAEQSDHGGDAGMSGGSPDDKRGQLWHGRFAGGPAEALQQLNDSLPFDQRMFREDIAGSRAHVTMLESVGLLTAVELGGILAALDEVEGEIEDGRMQWESSDEDIHTAVERRVTELEPAGAKMHTGRSRNDQVATDVRLWTLAAIDEISDLVRQLQRTLLSQAEAAGDAYLPGYTHLQQAQPVSLAHHLLAHGWMLDRDVDRLADARRRTDVSVLGAGALAGSSLPLDPARSQKELGMAGLFNNSLDAVADRDFVADTLYALTMIGVHLSRIGEEMIIWASTEFGFITLDDAFSTGSSMMPQKKNPDIAELARGKGGRLIGNLTGFLASVKGLPLTYNKDMQEDKEPLFDAVDTVRLTLLALDGMISTTTFNTDAMAEQASSPYAAATDLAEYLVANGMAFRDAHAVVGEHVRHALEGKGSLVDLVAADERLGAEAAAILEPGVSVTRRTTHGGGSPEAVVDQLERFRAAIAEGPKGDLDGAKSDSSATPRVGEAEGELPEAGVIGQLRIVIAERDRRIEALESLARTPASGDELGAARTANEVSGAHIAAVEPWTQADSDHFATWQKGTTTFGTPGAGHTDDLKVIKGIGPKMEKLLNSFGITAWEQVAALKKGEIKKLNDALETFPGRIERDEWVPQAKDLVKRFPTVNKRTSLQM